MRKTVSLYVESEDWELCKQLGYNMSDELGELMKILIMTSLNEDDERRTGRVLTRRIRLEEQLVLLDKKKEGVTEELERVVKQEVRFKEKLKIIEKNKLFSAYIRDLNKVILDHSYSLKEVLEDKRTGGILKKLEDFGPKWDETVVLGHVNKLRKYLEGY